MQRRFLLLVAFVGCQPSAAAPVAPVAPQPQPERSQPAVAQTPEPKPEPAQAPDISGAAGQEGIVFMRSQDVCEAWQFVEGGDRIETIADDSLELRLSFGVEIRDGQTVTLNAPKASSRGATTELECPDEAPTTDALFVEEADCEERQRGILVKRGCPTALLEADQRSAILHQLEADRRAVQADNRKNAAARVSAFDKRIRRSKAVYWATGDGGERCEKWAWRRAKRKGDDDRLVRKDAAGGGRTVYGFYTSVDQRTGRSSVNLLGPHSEGPDGGISLMNWEVQPLVDVRDQFAIVGEQRWYFSAAACKAHTSAE